MFYAPHKSLLTVLVDRYVSIGEGKSALLATILEEIISFSSCRTFSGPGSGWSRAGSISGYSASGRGSAGPGYWGGASDFWPGDEDAISDLMVIKRVDSNEVEYETKRKPTKVAKHNKHKKCMLMVVISVHW